MILTTLIATALVFGSPNAAVAGEAMTLAPVSVVDDDSDGDSDRQRGQRGRRRHRDSDSDRDSDRRDGRRDNCVDINGDGRCDFGSTRRDGGNRRDGCIDRNRDGVCDSGRGLPDMISAILIGRGQRSPADQWMSRDVRSVRWTDVDRNGVPERATFLDTAGRIAQVWLDNNRDGRADRVQFYQNGRLARVASR